MCAMRIADQMNSGASEIDRTKAVSVKPAAKSTVKSKGPVAAQSYAAPIDIPANRPDNSARHWEQGVQSKFQMATFKLCGSGREEWYDEAIDTSEWFEAASDEPVPVVRLTDCSNELCGIVHMRSSESGAEVCLSLITPKGNWQTGIWFNVKAQDQISVSWCTDWTGKKLTTISLEIQQTEH